MSPGLFLILMVLSYLKISCLENSFISSFSFEVSYSKTCLGFDFAKEKFCMFHPSPSGGGASVFAAVDGVFHCLVVFFLSLDEMPVSF